MASFTGWQPLAWHMVTDHEPKAIPMTRRGHRRLIHRQRSQRWQFACTDDPGADSPVAHPAVMGATVPAGQLTAEDAGRAA